MSKYTKKNNSRRVFQPITNNRRVSQRTTNSRFKSQPVGDHDDDGSDSDRDTDGYGSDNGDTEDATLKGDNNDPALRWLSRRASHIWRYKWYLLGVLLVMILVGVLAEGECRRNNPDSPWRPSAFIERQADRMTKFFRRVGWWIGRLTDIYYYFKDVLLDFVALLDPALRLIVSPVYTFSGWCDYYLAAYVGMGPALLTAAGITVVTVMFAIALPLASVRSRGVTDSGRASLFR